MIAFSAESNKLFKSLLITTVLAATLAGCSSTKVIKANSTPPIQASGEIRANARLDIGIQPLDTNIPDQEELEDALIVPDVRRAESRYIAYHLKDTLELTGHWGAVRVIPEDNETVHLTVSGKILTSDGEKLEVRVRAQDSTGKLWLDRKYSDNASKFSYEEIKEDPFQDLYNDIADDLLAARQKLGDNELAEIHQVTSLKYARTLAPEAFDDYVTETRSGRVEINKLPAENDSMMDRVERIKKKEYIFVDTLDDYYGRFYHDMKPSYDEWRFATYEEAKKLREMEAQATKRLLGGAAMIAGGIYASQQSQAGTYAGQAASAGAVIGGIGAIRSGLNKKKSAEIHEESLKELSQSLGSEITPFVLDIEGRTIELTGTIDDQYKQWRELLSEIYAEETGIPVE
ncbi:MAG: hypothetical protein WD356_06210 [Pseudomonadales bacterium]